MAFQLLLLQTVLFIGDFSLILVCKVSKSPLKTSWLCSFFPKINFRTLSSYVSSATIFCRRNPWQYSSRYTALYIFACMYIETTLSRSTSLELLDSQKRSSPSNWKKLAAAISWNRKIGEFLSYIPTHRHYLCSIIHIVWKRKFVMKSYL